MQTPEISAFGEILLFIIGAIVFISGGLITARLIRPSRPNAEKLSTYECGEEPAGTAWGQFNIRFFIIAIVFILFEVEILFLFPWATVFGKKEIIEGTNGLWGWFAVVEMFTFILMLAFGLAYVWKKGHLNWVKPEQNVQAYKGIVPSEAYQNFNRKISSNNKEAQKNEQKEGVKV